MYVRRRAEVAGDRIFGKGFVDCADIDVEGDGVIEVCGSCAFEDLLRKHEVARIVDGSSLDSVGDNSMAVEPSVRN